MLEDEISKHFKIPIELIDQTYTTPKNLIEDLELDQTHIQMSLIILFTNFY